MADRGTKREARRERAGLGFLTAAAAFALLVCAPAARADAEGAQFGAPPSGEIPILFNDRTVYAKPDVLRHLRVLAALVKDGQMYVPLRSMFEQMGATVSTSPDGKTITAVKADSSVSVTLGKAEVVVNGVTRPLDVPPMIYRGVVLVPVRVISEALGAYVLWVPERRVVVVRYIPSVPPTAAPAPTLAPTPAPTAPPAVPTAAPLATPTPAPRAPYGFVQAAYTFAKTYNEFADGADCPQSYQASAAYALGNSPFAVKVDYRQYTYLTSDNVRAFGNHYTRFATIDRGVALTPVFLARQSDLDERLEFRIAAPRIYVGVGYVQASNNYGYPGLSAVGFGIEKLPGLHPGLNLSGSAFYYPAASGNYTVTDPLSQNVGLSYRQQYNILKYDVGLSLVFAHSPAYIYGGFNGDQFTAKQNAPIGQTHAGPYVGLGLKL